jgi:hypothetical protein
VLVVLATGRVIAVVLLPRAPLHMGRI